MHAVLVALKTHGQQLAITLQCHGRGSWMPDKSSQSEIHDLTQHIYRPQGCTWYILFLLALFSGEHRPIVLVTLLFSHIAMPHNPSVVEKHITKCKAL